MKLFKTDIVLVEKGKASEAYTLLQKAKIKTYTSGRFRFDINTAVITLAVVGLAILLFTLI